MEVLVAAMLVVLVATGLFAALDASGHTTGTNRARTMASLLAQQDQERMRSYPPDQLSNLRDVNTQTVGGVTYTITSRGDWLTDRTGNADCSSNASADYIKISSRVTWPNMVVPPVQVDSIVAPPNGSLDPNDGALAVKVMDRNGNGVPGIAVSIAGSKNLTDTTDANGCVLWGGLPSGNYNLSFSRPGWVDPNGLNLVKDTPGVVAQSTSTVSYQYDVAGSINVSFDTRLQNGTTQPSAGSAISVAHPNFTAPKVFTAGSPQATIGTTSLFPFTSPYGVYAGDCMGADPRNYGASAAAVTLAPGAVASVTVRQPAVNVTVTRGRDAQNKPIPLQNANVKFTPTATGCATAITRSTNVNGQLKLSKAAPANSYDPGLPYGTYNVCADDGVRKATATVNNKDPNGTPSIPLDIPTSGGTGTCP